MAITAVTGGMAVTALFPGLRGDVESGVTMTAMEVLAWLLIGHAIADFALQTEWMALAKQPGRKFDGEVIWPTVLTWHAAIHAGAVKLATGSWLLAGLEFAAHAAIDYARGRGRLSFNADQAAHVGCKLLWSALA